MCGLAVIFAYAAHAPPVDARELDAIRDAMSARGPDDVGAWLAPDNRVGLGHRRLAIIDLSPAGHQPMALPDQSAVITYNGEIYNFAALRSELLAQGRALVSHSDTEVLLHLYERDGADCVRHLRGMFAFAIWDARKRGLFLARDPLGIKPIYLADDGATVRVASQVKALLAGGRVGRGAEPAGHVGFFLWGHVPDPWTLHRDIRALPAGHTMWIDAHGPRAARSYFTVETALAAPTDTLESGALQRHLADSVRHHFVADTPVGVFLSAGIDSGVLASFAAREKGADLRTITLAFEGGTEEDESPLAARVAAAFGVRHETHRIGRAHFSQARTRLFRAMDQPTTDGINTYFVAEAARAAGLKVALSGLGGDELFAGYPSFRQIPRSVAALAPFHRCPAAGRAFRAVSAPLLRHLTSPKYAGLLEYGGTEGGAYLLRRGLFMPWELPDILDGDIVREGWRRLEPLARVDAVAAALPGARQKVSAMEMTFYMRDRLLRDADWAGMAHGVEIRVPYVDTALLACLAPALACPVPPDKRALAACAPLALPSQIVNREKTGFVVPMRAWLAGDGVHAAGERGLRGWARHVHGAFAA